MDENSPTSYAIKVHKKLFLMASLCKVCLHFKCISFLIFYYHHYFLFLLFFFFFVAFIICPSLYFSLSRAVDMCVTSLNIANSYLGNFFYAIPWKINAKWIFYFLFAFCPSLLLSLTLFFSLCPLTIALAKLQNNNKNNI